MYPFTCKEKKMKLIQNLRRKDTHTLSIDAKHLHSYLKQDTRVYGYSSCFCMILTHSNNNVNVNKNIINDVFFYINQNMNKKKYFQDLYCQV